MADLKSRLTIIERAMRRHYPSIYKIVLVNDPDGLGENDAVAGEFQYRRMPTETVEAFRQRAADDASARGLATIFFGNNEEVKGELA